MRMAAFFTPWCGAALVVLVLAVMPASVRAQSDEPADYAGTVVQWTSYRDVAHWLDANFTFDTARMTTVLERVRQSGPSGLLSRYPAATFALKQGYCTDAAGFAIDALNRVNPDYRARYVFIKNANGTPHHWVAGFQVDGKIHVMDYGAGPEWTAMRGVHGPYDSLDEYRAFLAGLRIRRFSPELVEWRTMPGQQD